MNFQKEYRILWLGETTRIQVEEIRYELENETDRSDLAKNQKKDYFASRAGQYGIEYCVRVKGDERGKHKSFWDYSNPTLFDIVIGLVNWIVQQTRDSMKALTVEEQYQIMSARNRLLEIFRETLNSHKTQQALTGLSDIEKGMDIEIGLCNPYSKATCFVLLMYSMEFGSPPLFAEINRVARDMDMSQLANLGPFARAFSIITTSAEGNRKANDKIKTGEQIQKEIGGENQNLAGTFLLFRGAHMKEEWLRPWIENVGKNPVRIPGFTSVCQSLKVALGFSGCKTPKADYTSVVFVFCFRNYQSPDLIRLNNEAYTSFPVEGESLMTEGTPVDVIGVETAVINNDHAGFQQFVGKTITIVYLFSSR